LRRILFRRHLLHIFFSISLILTKIYFAFSSTADDDNEILPPQLTEIKEGQWLGVTVSSQRPSGVVSIIEKNSYQTKLFGEKSTFEISSYQKIYLLLER
jgi:hypothetical protein